jgi:hypothetical protein
MSDTTCAMTGGVSKDASAACGDAWPRLGVVSEDDARPGGPSPSTSTGRSKCELDAVVGEPPCGIGWCVPFTSHKPIRMTLIATQPSRNSGMHVDALTNLRFGGSLGIAMLMSDRCVILRVVFLCRFTVTHFRVEVVVYSEYACSAVYRDAIAILLFIIYIFIYITFELENSSVLQPDYSVRSTPRSYFSKNRRV